MKKEIKIAVAVILSIWFFVMGFEIGTYKERKANISTTQEVVNTVTPIQNTTVPTTATTTQPIVITTTTTPAITEPTSGAPVVTGTTQPQPGTSGSSSLSKQQVIEKVNAHMAALKAEKNMSAHMYENIIVNVTDCSVPSAIDIVNGIIENIAGMEESDYVFTDGKTASGETVYALVPPLNKDFLLTDAGVATATAKTVGTDTVYTVTFVEEKTTAAAPIPTYNSTAIGYLDLTSLDLPGVTIKQANMTYTGSKIELTVNSDGKVTKLVNSLPMTGYGEAQVTFFNGNASFEGYLDEQWTFTY